MCKLCKVQAKIQAKELSQYQLQGQTPNTLWLCLHAILLIQKIINIIFFVQMNFLYRLSKMCV